MDFCGILKFSFKLYDIVPSVFVLYNVQMHTPNECFLNTQQRNTELWAWAINTCAYLAIQYFHTLSNEYTAIATDLFFFFAVNSLCLTKFLSQHLNFYWLSSNDDDDNHHIFYSWHSILESLLGVKLREHESCSYTYLP